MLLSFLFLHLISGLLIDFYRLSFLQTDCVRKCDSGMSSKEL